MAVLSITLYKYDQQAGTDIGIFLVYGMLFLSFPISIIVAGGIFLLVLLQEKLGVPILDLIGSNYLGFAVMWLAFFLAGYLQWFKFLPWLLNKWHTRKKMG